MPPAPHFAVLESRWWDTGNHSTRGLFAAVAELHYGNPSAFYYDMFAEEKSLAALLAARGSDGGTEVVYLATHGNENEIAGLDDATISRVKLRNAIEAANAKKQIRGLFLGTCLAGNHSMAKFLLDPCTNLEWVAGYGLEVDWIDGSAIDMIFFSRLAEEYVENASRKKGKLSPFRMAHRAASNTVQLVPGAVSKYKFNLFHSEKGALKGMYAD
jgi:hypothetical protein